MSEVYTYRNHKPSDAERQFDLTFDRNSYGESFSCELIASASQAQCTLEDFRFGFLYDSREHIERSIRFPLTISHFRTRSVAEEGEDVTVNNFEEWIASKDQLFDSLHTALISCANLKTVRIYKSRGFAIKNGIVWFTGEDVTVRKINLMPFTEDELTRECIGGPRR